MLRPQGAQRWIWQCLLGSLVSCVAFPSETLFDEEGVSLLQIQSRPLAHRGARVFVPTTNQTFIGRYEVAKKQNQTFVSFDAIGFEIQFEVHGATEVEIMLEQMISGPFGWYEQPESRSQYLQFQRPKPFQHHNDELSQGTVTSAMQPAGSQPHHFLVYVDGVPQRTPLRAVQACRICTFDTADAVPGKAMPYLVATGLSPDKSHSIRIVKTSEPEWCVQYPTPNGLSFYGLMLDSGEAVQPAASHPQHRIEFIGDSWMAGFANVCNGTYDASKSGNTGGEPPEIVRYGSYALAWPFISCEGLGAECHSTILSGIGVYCNTHPDDMVVDCMSEDRLPQFWQRSLATVKTSHWDVSRWTPNVVVLAASQNDHMFVPARSKPDALRAYEQFIGQIASAYKDTKIIVTCGPFEHAYADRIGGPECALGQQAVDKQRQRGVDVQFLSLMGFARDSSLGQCYGHADEQYSQKLGKYFADWLQELL